MTKKKTDALEPDDLDDTQLDDVQGGAFSKSMMAMAEKKTKAATSELKAQTSKAEGLLQKKSQLRALARKFDDLR